MGGPLDKQQIGIIVENEIFPRLIQSPALAIMGVTLNDEKFPRYQMGEVHKTVLLVYRLYAAVDLPKNMRYVYERMEFEQLDGVHVYHHAGRS